MQMMYGGPPSGPGGRLDRDTERRLREHEDAIRGPYYVTWGDPRAPRSTKSGPFATLEGARRDAVSVSRSLRRWVDDDRCGVEVRSKSGAVVARVHFTDGEPAPGRPIIGAFGRSQRGGW